MLRRQMVGIAALIVALDGYSLARSEAKPEPSPCQLLERNSLAGWTIEGGCRASVENGVLTLHEGDGWLRHDRIYTDFALHVEWKAQKNADYDSGVYIRTLRGGEPFPKNSYQLNLLQGQEGNIKNISGATSKGLVVPGEWNSFDIVCRGDMVSLSVNGKPAYSVRGLARHAGYIGLQAEVTKGGRFQFRNMHVTEFGWTPLFNGRDLSGWTGLGAPAEVCWQVEDGLLACNGRKGPSIRTADEYGDFNLRLDFLVSPKSNSGVLVRVPEDGNHHRVDELSPPAGFEVQIIDDDGHDSLRDYQHSAGLYDIAGPNPPNVKPAGEWNTLEINCRRRHVSISQNGQVVVDVTEETHPSIKLRQTKGYLGLQRHNGVVKFRNVRVGPALVGD